MTSFTRFTSSMHVAGAGLAACLLTACPMDDDDGGGAGGAPQTSSTSSSTSTATSSTSTASASGSSSTGSTLAPTHTGLVSIQDMSIAGLPQAGHGLTIQIGFTAARPPTYDEKPGQPTGCKAWSHDVATNPPPPPTDQGELRVDGLQGGAFTCKYEAAAGYVCPLSSRSSQVVITPGENGAATFVDAGASFTAGDIGRHVRVRGASSNAGVFPIVAVPSATTAVIFAPAAQAEDATLDYDLLAGAGPTPGNPNDPIAGTEAITVSLVPGGGGAFHFPAAGPIVPGGAFTPDDASAALLRAVPIDGSAFTLGCSGAGGTCGAAALTVVRVTTTDADVTGLSPAAMPPPVRRMVDVLCAELGDAPLTVPAEAMALIAEANAASPVTRIRTAFMREGFALVQNAAPEAPNPARILVGHGVLGFTSP